MPNLHTMALWNGGKGEACAFVYRQQSNSPSIAWRGTWAMKLELRVIPAWDRAASRCIRNLLLVELELLCRGTISSHGDAIHHLGLPSGVVDAVSL